MNYVGNKYKYLKQLHEIFPKSINNFIDLFCGGTDVSINTPAITKYANDINTNIIDIYKSSYAQTVNCTSKNKKNIFCQTTINPLI